MLVSQKHSHSLQNAQHSMLQTFSYYMKKKNSNQYFLIQHLELKKLLTVSVLMEQGMKALDMKKSSSTGRNDMRVIERWQH